MPPNKKLILHVGLPKTGSTSIQLDLYKNRRWLKKHGYRYLTHSIDGQQRYNINFSLYYFIKNENKDWLLRRNVDFDAFRKQFTLFLEKQLSKEYDFILSGEHISNLHKNELQRLYDFLTAYDLDIRVIGFYRDPLHFITSLASERVKNGGAIDEVLRKGKAQYQSRCITSLKEVFNKVDFYSFDELKKGGQSPVEKFYEITGLTHNKVSKKRVNQSASNQAVSLLNHINTVSPRYLGKYLNVMRTKDDINPLLAIKGDKFKLGMDSLQPCFDALLKEKKCLESLMKTSLDGDHWLENEAQIDCDWGEESINSLVNIIPSLSRIMLSRTYDYFYFLHKKGSVDTATLNRIGERVQASSLRKRWFIRA